MGDIMQLAIELEALRAQHAELVRRGFHAGAREVAAEIRRTEKALADATDALTPATMAGYFVGEEQTNG